MAKILVLARVVAAAPLLYMGYQYVSGTAGVQPMLEGLDLPSEEQIVQALPWVEIVAGALLLLGIFPRLGALLGLAAAGLTAYAQNQAHDPWPGEPPVPAALVVAGLSLLVLLAGGGASKSSGGESARSS